MSSLISVIICTHNRASLLKRSLSSLSQQSLSPKEFEVIVVDDGSQDNTAKVCDMMHSKLTNLRHISTGNQMGLPGARNIGIHMSTGHNILFTDDDCIPLENWVERLSATLEQEPIVGGAVATPVSNYCKLCHNIAQFHAFMPGQKAGPTTFLAGANMAFRRSVLKELNGFKTGINYADDMEISLRARLKGYRVFFVPKAIVIHDPPRTTLTSILKYSSHHAATTILLRNQYQSLLHTPFILRSPALTLVAAPLMALKVTADIYTRNRSMAKLFWTVPMVYALKLAWCWGAARGLRNPYRVNKKR